MFFIQRWTKAMHPSGNSNISRLVILVLFHWYSSVELDRSSENSAVFIYSSTRGLNTLMLWLWGHSYQSPTNNHAWLLPAAEQTKPQHSSERWNEYLNRNHAYPCALCGTYMIALVSLENLNSVCFPRMTSYCMCTVLYSVHYTRHPDDWQE